MVRVRDGGRVRVRLLRPERVRSTKPVLLYCPGIELTGYSLHRQVAELSAEY